MVNLKFPGSSLNSNTTVFSDSCSYCAVEMNGLDISSYVTITTSIEVAMHNYGKYLVP